MRVVYNFKIVINHIKNTVFIYIYNYLKFLYYQLLLLLIYIISIIYFIYYYISFVICIISIVRSMFFPLSCILDGAYISQILLHTRTQL
jgi:hypothetical protein